MADTAVLRALIRLRTLYVADGDLQANTIAGQFDHILRIAYEIVTPCRSANISTSAYETGTHWPLVALARYANMQTALPVLYYRRRFVVFPGWASELTVLLGSIGRNLGKLLLTMFTVFFLYRDGGTIVRQWRNVVRRFFAERLDPYMLTIATVTRAVVYGLALTAIAQRLIAGIGYAIVSIEGAALFGALTGALSIVPVLGTGSIWGSLAVYLMMSGHLWKGIILSIWGAALVHPTDNILRPLLISNATKVPFLIVMFGVIGGLATLGLVGAFLGPIVLATGLAVWREWASEAKSPDIVRQRTEPKPRTP